MDGETAIELERDWGQLGTRGPDERQRSPDQAGRTGHAGIGS